MQKTKTSRLTAFFQAARDGDSGALRELLQDGVDVNLTDGYGRTALMLAARRGRVVCLVLLLGAKGIDVNLQDKDGWTALTSAAFHGHDKCAELLAKLQDTTYTHERATMQPTRLSQHTAFLQAARDGDSGALRELLQDGGVDVNLTDGYDRTALMRAVRWGYVACLELLLGAKGIDVNLQDKDGWTALIWATIKGHVAFLELLLCVEGIDVKLQDTDGWTALMWATNGEHDECVKMLTSAESNEAKSQGTGGTPVDVGDNGRMTREGW